MRTSEKTVTFHHPFILVGIDEEQPAGVYSVETTEEELDGMSISAYKRLETWIRLHESPDRPGVLETMKIDPEHLAAALARDKALTGPRVGQWSLRARRLAPKEPGLIREWQA